MLEGERSDIDRAMALSAGWTPVGAGRRRRGPRKPADENLFTVRGVPPELRKEIQGVARELGVTVGEVVRVFLEYGLREYRGGRLKAVRQAKDVKYGLMLAESPSPRKSGNP